MIQEQEAHSKLAGQKRSVDETVEIARKRIKMRDLDSVFRSQESNSHCSNYKEPSGEQVSQITNVTVTLDLHASQLHKSGNTTFPVNVSPVVSPLDLNRQASGADTLEGNATSECIEKPQVSSARELGFDLNAEDVTSSVNQDSSYPPRSGHLSKSMDVSECGSTTGPVEQKDPLTVWKEMKQNGFLSSSHGGILMQTSGFASSSHGGIPAPKQPIRKSKSGVTKKKIEIGKREQVDRFTKIAAPSGLLNGLNLGIINHVRNKKQVHSIIEALVRSEKLENGRFEGKQASHIKSGTRETTNTFDTGKHRLSSSHGISSLSALSGSTQTCGYPVSLGESETGMVDKTFRSAPVSHSAAVIEVDTLTMKVSSSAKASEESSAFSNEESANISSVSLLSVRAASVASQWLELLSQDIKGRLSALRRSKKRVRAVISTELPFLISKEFSSNQENDRYMMKISSDVLADNTAASMHLTRWSKLFDQMDKALSEEEKQLESWLLEVKEMQTHCDHGLQNFQLAGAFGSQHQGTLENCTRTGRADGSTRELAVRAAAASIYSTCNFLMAKENVTCL